jgi:hypothetical protein
MGIARIAVGGGLGAQAVRHGTGTGTPTFTAFHQGEPL